MIAKTIKILKWIFIILIMLGIIFFILIRMFFGPITKDKANGLIQEQIENTVGNNKAVRHFELSMYSPTTGYDESFVAGTKSDASPVEINDRYHSASVGKTFTTTLTLLLVEKGIISLDNKMVDILNENIYKNLYVINGVDYADQVTVKQLLNHTSGVADYYEGPVIKGKDFKKLMIEKPDNRWYPIDLINFTKENQIPYGKPGEQFYYSDTGYILAGLILEEVTGKSFGELLHKYIFKPVGMKDSNLMFYTQAISGRDDILGIYLDDIDISNKKVLSADWSGGGLVTTNADLRKFIIALHDGSLISKEHLNMMKTTDLEYDKGIYYGMGMMTFNLGELSPMLGRMKPLYGGVGATGSLMLYDNMRDLYIVLNLGTLGQAETSITELIKILITYDRIK